MKKNPFILLAVLLFTVLLGNFPLQAKPGREGKPPRDREEMRERVQTIIIGKFATELDLSSEQAEKFFPLLKQHHNKVEDILRDQQELRREMDELSESKDANQSEVNKLLDQSNEKQTLILNLKRDFLKSVDGILTPQQVSKCSILMDEVPRKIREFIEERKGGRGHDGPPEGGRRPKAR